MSKPTIFFSHSSKDKDLMVTVKSKIDNITGGVLDIFLSSDGQSIPFGSNWLHKIEEGLKQASIMFVFVTPNSILSNWIYFEAGFAYSKGIEVIPVGVGIDVGLLKAPLNLLQGFNINSADGLNNFISIINKKFEYRFADKFADCDFINIMADKNEVKNKFDLAEIFELVEYEFRGGINYTDKANSFLEHVKEYLAKQSIKFSYESKDSVYIQKIILVYGIKIFYNRDGSGKNSIKFTISPYNFEKSYQLLVELFDFLEEIDAFYLRFYLRNEYSFTTGQEQMASIISMYPEEFSFVNEKIGSFEYIGKGLRYTIYPLNNKYNEIYTYVLGISFVPKCAAYRDIQDLLLSLVDKDVIYKK